MGRVVGLVLVGAALAGTAAAAYNAVRYDVVQPFPLAWNHSPEALELIALRQERAKLLGRIDSARRMASLGGLHMPAEAPAGHVEALQADLAALDAHIRALETRLRGLQGARGRS